VTVEFALPDIGEGLHEAEIVRWLVAEGQAVERNQPFVEIMTDKANVEMPAPVAGVVTRLGPGVGDVVRVGELLIVIDDGSAGTRPDAATGPAPDAGHPRPGRRPKASPSTRRLAAELGIDLAAVAGTGPGGRILADDVRAAAPTETSHSPGATPHAGPPPRPTTAPPDGVGLPPVPTGPAPRRDLGWMEAGVHPLRGIRRATARAMDRSWSTIPHISASREIDATALLEARARLRELQGPEGPAITPLALVVMAVARALRRYPMMNGALDLEAETITIPDRVGIGIAVATEQGLVVPVIADADRLGVVAVASEIERLSAAARGRTIRPEDLAGGTHTITNYGSAGGHLAAPIIRPGETAITGLGGIAERPIVVDGEVVARPTLPVVVCSDHRLVDGDLMSGFHHDICLTLSAPIGLLL
jgi:pyruvate dehydrogenase E2 component (dihydrolipoamide acetyltransferase)